MTDQPQEPSKPPEPNRAASGCLILILVLVIPGAIFLIRGDDQSADSPTTTTRTRTAAAQPLPRRSQRTTRPMRAPKPPASTSATS
jgi:hypothetical protein